MAPVHQSTQLIPRFSISALVLAALVSTASAQTAPSFSARVVDHQGTAVVDAIVSVVGVPGSTRTDADGHFQWQPAPTPPFQVLVTLPNGTVARPFTVTALSSAGEIRIDALTSEAVTVLGAAPSIQTAPAAGMTLLSSRQIAERTPENLMQALETVPGVNKVSEGHAAVPAVRGLARGRTLLLIDGARVNSERRVGPSATFLDPSVVENIEVARGPGSVAYGSDAFGGVVSVRTRRALPGSPLQIRATGTLGAGVPEGRGSVEIAQGFTRGGMLVQAHVRNAEDYDSPDGTVLNSGWEDRGALLAFSHEVTGGLMTLAWQGDFARDFERPRNNSQSVRFYYPFEDSQRFTGSYQRAGVAGLRQLTITGFFGTIEQRTDQDRFATAIAGRSIERADITARDFQLRASGDRMLAGTRLEIGAEVNGRFGLEAFDLGQTYNLAGALTAETVNVSIESARRTDLAVFAQADRLVGTRTRLSGGLRADRVSTRNQGGYFGDQSLTNGAAAGFGAATFAATSAWSITGQVSRGFRDPVLSDRFFRGPSGRGFVTGNPDLKPETSLQFDVSTRYLLPRVQLAAYVYHYRITDLVERYQTQTDFFFFRNRGRARLRGVELEATTGLGRGISLEIGAQRARGTALDDGAALDDMSPDTLLLTGRKTFAGLGYALARLSWYGEDDRPGPTEITGPGATVFDLGGGWTVRRGLEVRAIARNLFDERYYASPDPRWVYAPGRSINVTAAVQF